MFMAMPNTSISGSQSKQNADHSQVV